MAEPLEFTGRPLGGFLNDIRRRLPHYGSDFTDGMTPKTLGATLFLFFACLAPAIAFGGLLSVLTGGQIGAIEMILATALCGIVYALTSAQPLTILGSTGPVVIFLGILYNLTEARGLPFLPTLSWVGIWTCGFLLILAFTDASALIRHFTRFTDETFAALISLIFISEAVKDIKHAFDDAGGDYGPPFFALTLALGTFGIAMYLSRFRTRPYLRAGAREFLADFSAAIAVASMTIIAVYAGPVEVPALDMPSSVTPSIDRAWLVNPFDAPMAVRLQAAIPALLVTILLYLDQNITVRLVNDSRFKLKKGAGYHLDLAVVGVLVGICSLLGLPWMVAATVRSLNHVRALNKTVIAEDGTERIEGTVETRLTGLLVHLLVGLSLLFIPLLRQIPMPVLFGLFLYMGVASMSGNQLFERIELALLDKTKLPDNHWLRNIPDATIARFTFVQILCLAVLWVIKTSKAALLFPLFIALLVPVRWLLGRFFSAEDLDVLDAEEHLADEEFRETD